MLEPGETRGTTATRHCASCGAEIGAGHFCSNCGQPIPERPTEDLGPFPRHDAATQRAAETVRGVEAAERLGESTDAQGRPLFSPSARPETAVYPARTGGRGRTAVIAACVVAALAAVGVLLALTVFSGGGDANAAYRSKVADTFAPVLDANRDVSRALAGVHGAHPTAAKQAVLQAERATSTAQGALGAISVPSGSRQVATQARQALDREATYLTAVSSVLNHPSSPVRSQLQALAGNVTSGFDAVDAPLSGAPGSVTGADALTTWAQHVAHSTRGGSSTSSAGGSGGSTPGPYAGQRDCGGGIHAGPNTSCDFAQNVFDAYYAAPGSDATVEVYSPVTGRTYTMSCSPAGDGVTCSGGNGASVSW